MNTKEFSDEFDVLLNSYNGTGLLDFNEYEKSVFLTEAQEEIVNTVYRGFTQDRESFEETEFKRRHLGNLVKQANIVNTFSDIQNIDENSIFFELPEEVIAIVNERLKIGSDDLCLNNKIIQVVPIRHDEYNTQKDNPFRKPKVKGLYKTAWRMDYGNVSETRVIEIIYPEDITPNEYIVRYIKKPRPIVLVDFDDNSINGISTEQTSELHENYHREILNLAVRKAVQSKTLTMQNNNN